MTDPEVEQMLQRYRAQELQVALAYSMLKAGWEFVPHATARTNLERAAKDLTELAAKQIGAKPEMIFALAETLRLLFMADALESSLDANHKNA